MTDTQNTGSSQGAFAPEPRVYELGYLIMPTVDEGNLAEQRDALVALITRYKGIVIDEGQPVLIDLAYPMEKVINNKKNIYHQAYFGWIKFDISPEEIETFTNEVESIDSLIRTLLIKTVRENTLTSDQPFRIAKNNSNDELDEDQDIDLASDSSNDLNSAESEKEVETELTGIGLSEPTIVKEGPDDLTKIEGIGPVIAETMNKAGVLTFNKLAVMSQDEIQDMISDVRGNHNSTTWPEQAQLAADGRWEALQVLQDGLDGGVAK